MNSKLEFQERITVHPDRIILTKIPYKDGLPFHKKIEYCYDFLKPGRAAHLQDGTRTANGHVSKIARRKIDRAIDYLLTTTHPTRQYNPYTGHDFTFKIAFITLDLPSTQQHTDNQIKSLCLNQILIELTTYCGVSKYIWRAEKQKNGNVHFHIIVDHYVSLVELRTRWNRIIEKLGYVSRYREAQIEFHRDGFRYRPELAKTINTGTGKKQKGWNETQQLKAYQQGVKTNWSHPNSTDIHNVQFVTNLKAYVSKYMQKDGPARKNDDTSTTAALIVHGRIWSCSTNLSKIEGAVIQNDPSASNELHEAIKKLKPYAFYDDYFSIFFINFETLKSNGFEELFTYFTEYLQTRFNYNYQTTLYN